MTFRYEGTKDINGTKYAVIKPQRKIEFENPPAEKAGQPKLPAARPNAQLKIKEQTSDGEMLFNIAAGRLQSTSLTHNLVVEANENGKPVQEQKFDQKINVTMTPAGEKKADNVKAAKTEKAAKPK
jgi:hypothetical protein